MIAITGANGQLGRATIEFLSKKIDPSHIVAIVRDPQKAHDLERAGIQIRVAEYDNLDSLNQAFQGTRKVLQISAIQTGEQGHRQEKNVVDVARQQGVQHIIYTSALQADRNTNFFSAWQCLHTENVILTSGLPYTILRNSLYLETIPEFIGSAWQQGAIYFPAGNGSVSFVSRLDIAEALSIVLTDDRHLNKQYEITGSHAYSFGDLAGGLNAATGIPVQYIDILDSVLSEELATAQLPAEQIEWFISLAKSMRANEFAHVDDTLERLLGRKPLTVSDYLKTTYAQ